MGFVFEEVAVDRQRQLRPQRALNGELNAPALRHRLHGQGNVAAGAEKGGVCEPVKLQVQVLPPRHIGIRAARPLPGAQRSDARQRGHRGGALAAQIGKGGQPGEPGQLGIYAEISRLRACCPRAGGQREAPDFQPVAVKTQRAGCAATPASAAQRAAALLAAAAARGFAAAATVTFAAPAPAAALQRHIGEAQRKAQVAGAGQGAARCDFAQALGAALHFQPQAAHFARGQAAQGGFGVPAQSAAQLRRAVGQRGPRKPPGGNAGAQRRSTLKGQGRAPLGAQRQTAVAELGIAQLHGVCGQGHIQPQPRPPQVQRQPRRGIFRSVAGLCSGGDFLRAEIAPQRAAVQRKFEALRAQLRHSPAQGQGGPPAQRQGGAQLRGQLARAGVQRAGVSGELEQRAQIALVQAQPRADFVRLVVHIEAQRSRLRARCKLPGKAQIAALGISAEAQLRRALAQQRHGRPCLAAAQPQRKVRDFQRRAAEQAGRALVAGRGAQHGGGGFQRLQQPGQLGRLRRGRGLFGLAPQRAVAGKIHAHPRNAHMVRLHPSAQQGQRVQTGRDAARRHPRRGRRNIHPIAPRLQAQPGKQPQRQVQLANLGLRANGLPNQQLGLPPQLLRHHAQRKPRGHTRCHQQRHPNRKYRKPAPQPHLPAPPRNASKCLSG